MNGPVAECDPPALTQRKRLLARGRLLGHVPDQDQQSRRQYDQHGDGKKMQHAALVFGIDPEDRRHAGREQDAEDDETLARAGDPRALVIGAGQLGAPRCVRQQHHGPGDIGDGGPQEEVAGTSAGGRHEQQPGADQEQGTGRDQPRPPASEPGRQAIAQLADQRIAQHIQEPRAEQHEAHAREAEADMLGVERRQIDIEWQIERGERKPSAP
jgi:hypothetical protein